MHHCNGSHCTHPSHTSAWSSSNVYQTPLPPVMQPQFIYAPHPTPQAPILQGPTLLTQPNLHVIHHPSFSAQSQNTENAACSRLNSRRHHRSSEERYSEETRARSRSRQYRSKHRRHHSTDSEDSNKRSHRRHRKKRSDSEDSSYRRKRRRHSAHSHRHRKSHSRKHQSRHSTRTRTEYVHKKHRHIKQSSSSESSSEEDQELPKKKKKPPSTTTKDTIKDQERPNQLPESTHVPSTLMPRSEEKISDHSHCAVQRNSEEMHLPRKSWKTPIQRIRKPSKSRVAAPSADLAALCSTFREERAHQTELIEELTEKSDKILTHLQHGLSFQKATFQNLGNILQDHHKEQQQKLDLGLSRSAECVRHMSQITTQTLQLGQLIEQMKRDQRASQVNSLPNVPEIRDATPLSTHSWAQKTGAENSASHEADLTHFGPASLGEEEDMGESEAPSETQKSKQLICEVVSVIPRAPLRKRRKCAQRRRVICKVNLQVQPYSDPHKFNAQFADLLSAINEAGRGQFAENVGARFYVCSNENISFACDDIGKFAAIIWRWESKVMELECKTQEGVLQPLMVDELRNHNVKQSQGMDESMTSDSDEDSDFEPLTALPGRKHGHDRKQKKKTKKQKKKNPKKKKNDAQTKPVESDAGTSARTISQLRDVWKDVVSDKKLIKKTNPVFLIADDNDADDKILMQFIKNLFQDSRQGLVLYDKPVPPKLQGKIRCIISDRMRPILKEPERFISLFYHKPYLLSSCIVFSEYIVDLLNLPEGRKMKDHLWTKKMYCSWVSLFFNYLDLDFTQPETDSFTRNLSGSVVLLSELTSDGLPALINGMTAGLSQRIWDWMYMYMASTVSFEHDSLVLMLPSEFENLALGLTKNTVSAKINKNTFRLARYLPRTEVEQLDFLVVFYHSQIFVRMSFTNVGVRIWWWSYADSTVSFFTIWHKKHLAPFVKFVYSHTTITGASAHCGLLEPKIYHVKNTDRRKTMQISAPWYLHAWFQESLSMDAQDICDFEPDAFLDQVQETTLKFLWNATQRMPESWERTVQMQQILSNAMQRHIEPQKGGALSRANDNGKKPQDSEEEEEDEEDDHGEKNDENLELDLTKSHLQTTDATESNTKEKEQMPNGTVNANTTQDPPPPPPSPPKSTPPTPTPPPPSPQNTESHGTQPKGSTTEANAQPEGSQNADAEKLKRNAAALQQSLQRALPELGHSVVKNSNSAQTQDGKQNNPQSQNRRAAVKYAVRNLVSCSERLQPGDYVTEEGFVLSNIAVKMGPNLPGICTGCNRAGVKTECVVARCHLCVCRHCYVEKPNFKLSEDSTILCASHCEQYASKSWKRWLAKRKSYGEKRKQRDEQSKTLMICTNSKKTCCVQNCTKEESSKCTLVQVPVLMREAYYSTGLLLTWFNRLCHECRNLWMEKAPKFEFKNCRFYRLDAKAPKISHSLTEWHWKQYTRLKQKLLQTQEKLQTLTEQWEAANIRIDKKDKRKDPEFRKMVNEGRMDEYFEKHLQRIDFGPSNRFINHVEYEQLSNEDCAKFCGLAQNKLIEQARFINEHGDEDGRLSVVELFHIRVRIRRYFSWEIHSLIFGLSPSWLKNNWLKNLRIVYRQYARHFLVGSDFWTREQVHKNTPLFAYEIRGIDSALPLEQLILIVNQDSTYQYHQQPQAHYELFKATKSPHKYSSLVKVHLWSAANGKPIYFLVSRSDWDHADTDIFDAAFNLGYLRKCQAFLQRPRGSSEETPVQLMTTNLEVIEDLLKLNEIFGMIDHFVSDNGYRNTDTKIKRPERMLGADQWVDDGKATASEAAWKRSCSAIRQTCERLHKWLKDYEFCGSIINHKDIKWVKEVWSIVCADFNWLDRELMRDDSNSLLLSKRLLDMRLVMSNPLERFCICKLTKAGSNLRPASRMGNGSNSTSLASSVFTDRNMDIIAASSTVMASVGSQQHEAARARLASLENESAAITNLFADHEQTIQDVFAESKDCAEDELADLGGSDDELEQKDALLEDEIVPQHDGEDVIVEESEREQAQNSRSRRRIHLRERTQSKAKWEKYFTLRAKGLMKIWQWFVVHCDSHKLLSFHERDKWTTEDVENYIGKKFTNQLARGYLRRAKLMEQDLEVWENKQLPSVLLFRNLSSKWKRNKCYDIVVSFEEMRLYNFSCQQFEWSLKPHAEIVEWLNRRYSSHNLRTLGPNGPHPDMVNWVHSNVGRWPNWRAKSKDYLLNVVYRDLGITISEDDQHWLKHKFARHAQEQEHQRHPDGGQSHNHNPPQPAPAPTILRVSDFASDKYRDIQNLLRDIRNEKMKVRHRHTWNGRDLNDMTKAQLRQLCKEYEFCHTRHLNLVLNQLSKKAALLQWMFERIRKKEYIPRRQHTHDDSEEGVPSRLAADEEYKIETMPISGLHALATRFSIFGHLRSRCQQISPANGRYDAEKCYQKVKKDIMRDHLQEDLGIHRPGEKVKKLLYARIITYYKLRRENADALEAWVAARRESSSGEEALEAIRTEEVIEEQPAGQAEYDAAIREKYSPEINIAREKDWLDLDFSLFNSKLSRLQIICSCRSGAQLPSCCAHCGTIIWLIYCVLFDHKFEEWKKMITLEPEHVEKAKAMLNLRNYKQYKKEMAEENPLARCVCGRTDLPSELVFCEVCYAWWHAQCARMEGMKEIEACRRVFGQWWCQHCNATQAFLVQQRPLDSQ